MRTFSYVDVNIVFCCKFLSQIKQICFILCCVDQPKRLSLSISYRSYSVDAYSRKRIWSMFTGFGAKINKEFRVIFGLKATKLLDKVTEIQNGNSKVKSSCNKAGKLYGFNRFSRGLSICAHEKCSQKMSRILMGLRMGTSIINTWSCSDWA